MKQRPDRRFSSLAAVAIVFSVAGSGLQFSSLAAEGESKKPAPEYAQNGPSQAKPKIPTTEPGARYTQDKEAAPTQKGAGNSPEINAIIMDAQKAITNATEHPLLGKPGEPGKSGTGNSPEVEALLKEAQAAPIAAAAPLSKDTVLITSVSGFTLFPDTRKKEEDKPDEHGVSDDLKPGINILNLKTPEPEELKKLLQDKYVGKPLTFAKLDDVVKDIIAHYSQHDRPMTHVYIPEQQINDKVKIAVIEARFGKIKDGTTDEKKSHKWYKNAKIADSMESSVRHSLGDDIEAPMDKKSVTEALESVNLSPWARLGHRYEHPFRRVSATFTPGDELGLTDLNLKIDERRPINTYFSYENTGTSVIGEHRFTLGTVWYDAFGLNRDHQLGLQFLSGTNFDAFRGGVLSYQVPFKTKHQSLEFFAAYIDSSVTLPSGANATQDLKGTSWQLGLRHHVELPRLFGPSDASVKEAAMKGGTALNFDHQWAWYHELVFGLDYKVSNNNLAFGGTQVFASNTDIAQLNIGYAARETDPYGETTLHFDAFWSPGGVTSNNSDTTFEKSRELSKAAYYYGKLQFERTVDLPAKMMLQVRATGQYASENLLASEELGLGGFDTVRGYSERVARGDIGFYTQWELYSPALHPFQSYAQSRADKSGSAKWENGGQSELRFLVFFDYGITSPVNDTRTDFGNTTLMSMGFGLRYRFNSNVSFRADYGFQLQKLTGVANDQATKDDLAIDSSGHAHLGMTVNF